MDAIPIRPTSSQYKRCRRYDVPGHAHALTFSCFRRQPFLTRERTRRWMLDAIGRARDLHGYDLWAYVLMPEHVHLLVCPRSAPYVISAFLASVKIPVARRAVAFVRRHAPESLGRLLDEQPDGLRSHRFWQRGGGYDKNLWEPRYVWSMIDYIHANPVRRGLCRRPEDWPWSSAAAYLDRSAGPISIDWPTLPIDPRP